MKGLDVHRALARRVDAEFHADLVDALNRPVRAFVGEVEGAAEEQAAVAVPPLAVVLRVFDFGLVDVLEEFHDASPAKNPPTAPGEAPQGGEGTLELDGHPRDAVRLHVQAHDLVAGQPGGRVEELGLVGLDPLARVVVAGDVRDADLERAGALAVSAGLRPQERVEAVLHVRVGRRNQGLVRLVLQRDRDRHEFRLRGLVHRLEGGDDVRQRERTEPGDVRTDVDGEEQPAVAGLVAHLENAGAHDGGGRLGGEGEGREHC